MTFALQPSPSLELAAADLAQHLERHGDPFVPSVIGLGDRAQESWLRRTVATESRRGIAANWCVMPCRVALGRAVRACLVEEWDHGRWWELPPKHEDPWQPDRLRGCVVEAFRAVASEPECGDLSRYLYGTGAPPAASSWRELSLAGQVAQALLRLMRERPGDALRWAHQPADGGDDPPPYWFRRMCQQVGLAHEASPCQLHRRLLAGEGRGLGEAELVVFGFVPLSPAERDLISALGARMDISWFRPIGCPTRWNAAAPAGPISPLLAAFGAVEDSERSGTAQRLTCGSCEGERVSTRLGSLQRSVGLDRAIQLDTTAEDDDTLGFHACYGPLRQVELLRDALLRWFAADRELEPRDVLVLTPDLGTYAPLIQAVFARRGARQPSTRADDAHHARADIDNSEGDDEREQATRPPAIPVAIPDLGLASTNPVAEALLAALGLCEERVNAPRLLSLLSLDPVRKRFGISTEDASDLRALLVDSGIRWGLDDKDRDHHEQPALHQNTVEFGLERLALGALMECDEHDDVLDGDKSPLVPMPVEGRARVARVARLAAVVRAVSAARQRFRRADEVEARSLALWRQDLRQLLDDLCETSKAASWLRVQVDEVLDELLAGHKDDTGPRVGLRELRKLIAGRFELPTQGDRVISGAVHVRRLSIDAVTPAKLVCFLGMDDRAFPGAHDSSEWDPFRAARQGEHDPRAVERQAFLQALLAAKQRVLVAWCGFELKRGRELPPCVPVDELLGFFAEATGANKQSLFTQHARHPWSAEALRKGTYDRGLLQAARVVTGKDVPEQEDDPYLLPDEEHKVTDLALETLARDLNNTAKLFLYGRLDVYLDEGLEAVPEREPLELDALERWKVRDEAMKLSLGDGGCSPELLVRRLAGQGLLPLEAGGLRVAAETLEDVGKMREVYEAAEGVLLDGGQTRKVSFDLEDGPTVHGTIPRVRELGGQLLLEWLLPSQVTDPKRIMLGWVHLLAARAAGWPVFGARLVGSPNRGKATQCWLRAPDGDAAVLLRDLVAVWQRGRARRLPLFPDISFEAAKLLAGKSEQERQEPVLRAEVKGVVLDGWAGGQYSANVSKDRWVLSLFPDFDPVAALEEAGADSFLALALRVWEPPILASDNQVGEDWVALGGGA